MNPPLIRNVDASPERGGLPIWERGNQKVPPEWLLRYMNGRVKTLGQLVAAVNDTMAQGDASDTLGIRVMDLSQLPPFDYSNPSRLSFPSHFNSDPYLRQVGRADWRGVSDDLQIFAASLCQVMRRRFSIPLFVHAALRTKAEQDAAFEAGNSKLRWPNAPHCRGAAVDIVHGRFGWFMTKEEWAFIARVGRDVLHHINEDRPKERKIDLEWGGDWVSLYDPAHWQLRQWRQRDVPQAGEPVRKTPTFILSNI